MFLLAPGGLSRGYNDDVVTACEESFREMLDEAFDAPNAWVVVRRDEQYAHEFVSVARGMIVAIRGR